MIKLLSSIVDSLLISQQTISCTLRSFYRMTLLSKAKLDTLPGRQTHRIQNTRDFLEIQC